MAPAIRFLLCPSPSGEGWGGANEAIPQLASGAAATPVRVRGRPYPGGRRKIPTPAQCSGECRFGQHLRGEMVLVADQQAHCVAEDRSRFAQQRVRAVSAAFSRAASSDVALARLQPVVGIVGGQRVGGEAEPACVRLLALLALGIVAVAFGAALGLVETRCTTCPARRGTGRRPRPTTGIPGRARRALRCLCSTARHDRAEVTVLHVRRGGDAGPRQGIVVGAADCCVHRHRKAMSGATPCSACRCRRAGLGDRQLHLAVLRTVVGRPAVEVDQVLYRALAEGVLADDQAAAVVLDRADGEDLRGEAEPRFTSTASGRPRPRWRCRRHRR